MRSVTGSNAVTHEAVEGGKFYARTIFYDDAALDKNNKIRNSGMLDKAKLGLHENEDMRMVISCPSTLQWSMFKTKHAETYKLLTSKNSESDRIKGAKQLEILYPAWVCYNRL